MFVSDLLNRLIRYLWCFLDNLRAWHVAYRLKSKILDRFELWLVAISFLFLQQGSNFNESRPATPLNLLDKCCMLSSYLLLFQKKKQCKQLYHKLNYARIIPHVRVAKFESWTHVWAYRRLVLKIAHGPTCWWGHSSYKLNYVYLWRSRGLPDVTSSKCTVRGRKHV